ncbi:endoplasmic reticulum membrane sensor NFE2L1 isoform X1 [Centruroides vittatus]|uniref:endoplasmic reticulum membrane sensor NFE2L1 isoform X1 n=1 Tax=Centruroides vittatus TaxID=120091 RepID=UPI00350F74E0
MFRYKKIINSDLLQLALLVSLLRLDLDMYLDGRLENRFETHDIFLGTNLAYSPTQYHHLHHSYGDYVHSKSIDLMYDRFSIFAELNSLGRYDRFPSWSNDIFAYLVDQEQVHNSQQSIPNGSNDPPESANIHNEEQEITRNEVIESESTSDTHRDSQFSTSSSSELSFEDMNLIEILWKQDIDLGITKDAFDCRGGGEVSKTKQNENSVKPEKEPTEEPQIPPPLDPWEGIDYTIDGETGEHIILESSENQGLDATNSENCTLNDLDFQQLAEELQNIPLDEALFLFNDRKPDDVSDENVPKSSNFEATFPELRYENFSSDINMTLGDSNNECLINQMQDLESLLEKTIEENNDINQINEACLPVTDETWQNFTSCLAFSSNTSNNQNQFSEHMRNNINIPEHNRMLSNISTVNSNFSSLFPNVLFQNATLGSYSFQETERNIIQDSAISSSSALSNHSDPMAENMMNITYNESFPELFCPNNSSIPEFLENFVLDEDLQLMDMSCEEDDCDMPIIKQLEDFAETSDSAVSSMDSDKSSSDGEFHDSSSDMSSVHNNTFKAETFSFRSCSKDSSSSRHPPIAQKKYKYFGKKSLNFNEKGENDDCNYGKHENKRDTDNRKPDSPEKHNTHVNSGISENIVNEQFDKYFHYQNIGTFKNFEESIRHNHTYNLPSEAMSTKQKPVIRDKDYSDEASRDERRARMLKIPISNEDIIHLPIDEFNERLSKYELKEEQLALIKDIRRRGKNKVAAQNCRKRKIGQIMNLQEELQSLLEEKASLQAEQEQMLSYRRLVKDKYNQLYNLIAHAQSTSSNPQPSGPPNFFSQLTLNERDRNISIPSNRSSLNIDSDVDSSKGARSKRKVNRK